VRRSLAGISFAVTVLVAVAFLVPLAVLVGGTVRQRVLAEAFRDAASVGPVLVVTTEPSDLRRVLQSTSSGAAGRTTVYLPQALAGQVPDVAGPNVIGTVRARPADVIRAARTGRSFAAPVPGGVAVLQPVILGAGEAAVVVVMVTDDQLEQGVLRARLILIALAVALVLGSVAVADRLAARVVRAARALSSAAVQLGGGDVSVRIEPQGPPELQEAASAFNSMAARVNGLLAAERELAADLSHRLRTPLTALLLTARSLDDEPVRQQLQATVGRLEEEIDGIIRRTRRTQAQPAHCPDAVTVLRERLEFWGALADDSGRVWALHVPDAAVPVEVAAEDLAAAMDALLGNVFVHTPAGCSFTVSLTAGTDAVQVVVDDAGTGIADAKGALQRGASGAGSTGLGLDIARRLAESTGGALRIGSSPLGGARVELVLRHPGAVTARRSRLRGGVSRAGWIGRSAQSLVNRLP
jgi:signal transduction histidine kinase